jgi:hypothetical protein
MKCRIFKKLNGHLIITVFSEKNRLEEETDQELMDRQTLKLKHKDLPFVDLNHSALPSREFRDRWVMNADNTGVIIDSSLETRIEAIKIEESVIEIELNKPSPDLIIIKKSEIEIKKLTKSNWIARDKITKEIKTSNT